MSRLFYMDDLKFFAEDDRSLEEILQLVRNFSDDISIRPMSEGIFAELGLQDHHHCHK